MPLLRVIVIEETTSAAGPGVVLEDRDGRRAELAPTILTQVQEGGRGTVPAHIFDRNLISGKQRGLCHYSEMAQEQQIIL
tara:strand:+ start:8709 stop:8948 length:240 start_codon:yes stop_codon:yes gene_type:complete